MTVEGAGGHSHREGHPHPTIVTVITETFTAAAATGWLEVPQATTRGRCTHPTPGAAQYSPYTLILGSVPLVLSVATTPFCRLKVIM